MRLGNPTIDHTWAIPYSQHWKKLRRHSVGQGRWEMVDRKLTRSKAHLTPTLPVSTRQSERTVGVSKTTDTGQVQIWRNTSRIRRVELSGPRGTLTCGLVTNRCTNGIGTALVETDTRIGTIAIDTCRPCRTVIIQMATIFASALFVAIALADLAKRAIGVATTSGKTDTIGSGFVGIFFAELSG